jgi:hypothetical protein
MPPRISTWCCGPDPQTEPRSVEVVLLPVELAATERISLPGKLEWAEIRPRTIEQDLTAALNTLRAFWARTISTGATT